MADDGIYLPPEFFQGPWWTKRSKPLSATEAALDFLLIARDNGGRVDLSLRELALRWGWSRTAISRWVKDLESGLGHFKVSRNTSGNTYIVDMKGFSVPARNTKRDSEPLQRPKRPGGTLGKWLGWLTGIVPVEWLDDPEFQEALGLLLDSRKGHKAPNTERAARQIGRKMARHDRDAVVAEALRRSGETGWRTIFYDDNRGASKGSDMPYLWDET